MSVHSVGLSPVYHAGSVEIIGYPLRPNLRLLRTCQEEIKQELYERNY
jgi:hypothetical protein